MSELSAQETVAETTTADATPETEGTTESVDQTATDHDTSENPLKDMVKNAEKIAAKGKSQPLGKKAATQVVGAQKTAFTPNYKFTSLDKEFEFDEWAKPLVTSKEVEENLRKLYTERAGIDHIKQGRQEFATKAAEFEKKYTEQTEALRELGSFAQKGDYDSFFDALGINKDSVLKYAIELAKRESNPQLKAEWQANREAEMKQIQESQTAQEFQARQQEFEVQKRTWELDQVLTAPQVTDAQTQYDTALGRQGAFRDFVIQIGQSYAARGQDIPVQQAVGEALNHIKPFIGGVSASAQQVAPSQKVATPNTKPTIPSVEGRGVSPVKKSFGSFDEMKKYAKELSAQE
jgi:hypothetical protein